ncbi:MAG: sugar ABC transporter ATP-binding protein [Clostridia bacterium]|nr:sugar ABC transporter ATP-binding protein [Clostridia bacterium]
MNHVSKSFGGVHALKDVTLQLKKQHILALVGENGAGKSTLIKCLMGINKMDQGEIILDGQKVSIHHPSEAMRLGIAAVFQDLSLVNTLTLTENVFLSKEITHNGVKDMKAMMSKVAEVLKEFDVPLNPDDYVANLSAAQKQLTEILKAIAFEPKILILDEPTASLTERETDILFRIIAKLKAKGTSIIYISHRMNEITALADSVLVLRDGQYIGELFGEDINFDAIVKAMVGRKVDMSNHREKHDFTGVPDALKVENLCSNLFDHVSFKVRKGEIVGVAGLAGAGRTELVQSIFGILPITQADIYVDGQKLEKATPNKCRSIGLGMVPEQRLVQGLVTVHSIEDNITLPIIERFVKNGFVQRKPAGELADRMIKEFNIKTDSRLKRVGLLSGGNAQKVVFVKWLATEPKVLILDEPTAGIDVQSKYEIRETVQRLADETGLGVLFISSELPELLGIADRILVMNDFRIIKEVDNTVTQEEIMAMILDDKMRDVKQERSA